MEIKPSSPNLGAYVSGIDLSYDTGDTIEEFTVDFQVQYWYPDRACSGAW